MLLQVSDQGGGIPRSHTDLLFNYMFSTAPQPPKSDTHTAPLAGRYPVCFISLPLIESASGGKGNVVKVRAVLIHHFIFEFPCITSL